MNRHTCRNTTYRGIRHAIAKGRFAASGRTRLAELLILCARIDFNP